MPRRRGDEDVNLDQAGRDMEPHIGCWPVLSGNSRTQEYEKGELRLACHLRSAFYEREVGRALNQGHAVLRPYPRLRKMQVLKSGTDSAP